MVLIAAAAAGRLRVDNWRAGALLVLVLATERRTLEDDRSDMLCVLEC